MNIAWNAINITSHGKVPCYTSKKNQTYSWEGGTLFLSIDQERTKLVQIQDAVMVLVILVERFVQTTQENLENTVLRNDPVRQPFELVVTEDIVSIGVMLLEEFHDLVDKVWLS